MVDVEQLLAPISEDSPCGEDLSYDPDLAALETLIQGKAETQFSAAEEPNWKEAQKAAMPLFQRTKDLRVAVNLTLTQTKLEGWPGFAQGTTLLRGMMERYWAAFYPRLDPDDDNDPTERMNLLAALAAPEGTFGDPLRFVERLRAAPFCRSPRLGAFSLGKIAELLEGKKAEGESPAVPADPAAVEGAFRDTPEDFLAGLRAAVTGATADLEGINDFLDVAISGQRPNLEALEGVLREARSRLAAYAPEPSAAEADGDLDQTLADLGTSTGADAPGAGSPRPARRAAGTGEITSRDDVVRALDAVCAYYAAQEPSSPVPALLAHARKMVGMNYLQIVSVLTPDATPQVRLMDDSAVGSGLTETTPTDEIT